MAAHVKDPPQQPMVMAVVQCPSDNNIPLVLALALAFVRALVPLQASLVPLHEAQHRLQGCRDQSCLGHDASPGTGAYTIAWSGYLQARV